jgi:hypothetical protein
MNKMSWMPLGLFLCGSAIAAPFSLQCQFRSGAFIAVFDQNRVTLRFAGTKNVSNVLDPAGEAVTLVRSNSGNPDWLNFEGSLSIPESGQSDCPVYENGKCVSRGREFQLSLSLSALRKPGTRSGSLGFTPVSSYPPGEAFYNHDIYCKPAR